MQASTNQEQLSSSNDSIYTSPNESYKRTASGITGDTGVCYSNTSNSNYTSPNESDKRTVPEITIEDTGVYYSKTSNGHELQRSNQFGMNINRAYGAYGTETEDSESQIDYDYIIN